MEQNKTQKHISKRVVVISVIAAVAVVVAALSVYAGRLSNSDRIYDGVRVGDVDVSGMTLDEALSAVNDYLEEREDIVLKFKCDDTEFEIAANQISFEYDASEAVEKAYNAGRGGSFLKNLKNIMSYRKNGYTASIKVSYDKNRLLLLINDEIQDKIADPSPINVEIGSDRLYVTNPSPGKGIDEDEVESEVKSRLKSFDAGDVIELEIVTIEPDEMTFEEFYEKYNREAKDAVYTQTDDSYKIEPEVVGISLERETAEKIFEENKDNSDVYEIPAEITMPAVTSKILEDKYVNKIIASYTTSYAGSSANRCANIALAASKIDGYVINPGKRFSYNTVVGPRTAAAGFKSAHVYVGTEVTDGIGGGICQVSSTLYNAAVLADMKIVSRTNHSIPVSYVPLGRDATVSYGSIDFVFENNKTYPVSIKATASGGSLKISVVGAQSVDYTVDIVTETVGTIAYSTIKTEDSSLPEGETKTLSYGSNGSVVNSYRVYKKDGKEYSRTFEAKSTYSAVPAKVSVGTKKDVQPAAQTPEAQTPEAPEAQTPQQPSATVPEENTESSGSEANGTNPPADTNDADIQTDAEPEESDEPQTSDPLDL